MSTKKESIIQAEIMDWLRVQGILSWRCSLGPVIKGKGCWAKNPMKGHPDLAFVVDGRYGTIEVKSELGKLSTEQKTWANALKYHGCWYIVARSLDDVIRGFREYGINVPQKGIFDEAA